MTNIKELTQDGNMLFLLTMVHGACIARDKEFLLGATCAKILNLIPDSMILEALGMENGEVPSNLGKLLADKVDSGHKFVREYRERDPLVKSWYVTHPCGYSETVYNIKEFANDMGILPSGLTSVANNSMRQSYQGYTIRRIS